MSSNYTLVLDFLRIRQIFAVLDAAGCVSIYYKIKTMNVGYI